SIDLNSAMIAGLVLKAPRYEAGHVVEKGALLLKNTDRFDSFRRCVNMTAVLKHYVVVLEPSWSGYANLKLLPFTTFRDDCIVVMSPYPGDHRLLDHLECNLYPIPIGPADWVDPRVFRPLEAQAKQFDAVMPARWSLMKRHHVLFRTLRRIGDPSLRVA